MPIVSYLHHLCNAQTCQTYIHTLRWKDLMMDMIAKLPYVRICAVSTWRLRFSGRQSELLENQG